MDLLLNTNSTEEYKMLLTKILDDLIHPQRPDIFATHKNVSETDATNIEDFLIKFDFDCEIIDSELTKKKWERSKIDYFIQEITRRKTQLIKRFIAKFNSAYGKTLVNFNWSLKYVFGTSALKQIKYPVMQVILNTVQSKNVNRLSVYEFDKTVLLKIIHALERIS